MSKTPTTWLNTVKRLLKEGGPGTSMKTVLPLAKKEWALIKAGKHPTKMQATKSTTAKRKPRKSRKTKKRRRRKR